MRIVDLTEDSTELINGVAQIVLDGFEGASWPNIESALAEVRASLADGQISRVAVDDDRVALGWIGGNQQYDGHVWEMHPLVVNPARQRQGIGTALVADFERCVLDRGGETVLLGTDDLANTTSLV